MATHSRQSLLSTAKELALSHKGPLTRDEFIRQTGIQRHYIERAFPDGGWRELADLAGIEPHPSAHGRFSNDDLLTEYHSVVKKIEKIPSLNQFNAYAKYSSHAILRRFGGQKGILKAYREWLMEKEPDSPCFDLIDTKHRQLFAKYNKKDRSTQKNHQGAEQSSAINWTKRDGAVYGEPLNFRGLRHAPVNEQGVVYLFGMVAGDLDIIVESVQAAFPDCEAKRCVDHNKKRWQRVLIEFEYCSSNFMKHQHDIQGCDLIVCWENDWEDCPLEVIELRSKIKEFKS